VSKVIARAQSEDTLPKLLLRNAAKTPKQIAFREKDYGIWQSYTWKEVEENVRALALGLHKLGLKRGDKVSIVGDNRPHLYWVFLAVEAMGGVAVPIYQDSGAEEVQYVLNHAEVRFVIAENQEQVDKILEIKDGCPSIETLIYYFTRGLRDYDLPFLHGYADVQQMGRELDKAEPDLFHREVEAGSGDDVCLIAYTSGTTGNPKGVMHTHNSIITSAERVIEFEGLTPEDEIICYLPMAWVGDHFFFAQGVIAGFPVSCPESAETLLGDIRELGPTYFFAPPAIFENLLTNITIRMEDAGRIKKRMYDRAIDLARKVGIDILEGRSVGFLDRIRYAIGNFLVYGPLKDNLGLTRVRLAYTGGAPMGPDIFNFYRAIGFNLKQLYGQTESCAYACIQRNGDVRPDTVGPPAPGCEIRIADDGEVLVKSPGNFTAYYKNDEATAETLIDGWIHTGDAGIFTDEGHLKVIDRAKDVGKLTDGTLFAPQFLENKLKFFPAIREAVCHGAGRDFVTAFINIDLEAVGNWAERHNISYSSYTDLAGRDQVYEMIADCVDQVNQDLAKDSELAGSQIRRFLLLHKELDADDGELTRTRKVRRRIIAERYDPLIEALFSGAEEATIESQVTYEDGRKGMMKANVKVRDAKTHAPQRQAA